MHFFCRVASSDAVPAGTGYGGRGYTRTLQKSANDCVGSNQVRLRKSAFEGRPASPASSEGPLTGAIDLSKTDRLALPEENHDAHSKHRRFLVLVSVCMIVRQARETLTSFADALSLADAP